MTGVQTKNSGLFVVLSVCSILAGMLFMGAAFVVCPVVLERCILIDGELDSDTAWILLFAVSVVMIAAAICSLLLAKKMWVLHKAGAPTRKAIFVLMAMTISIVLALLLAEGWLRLTTRYEANLYSMASDGLWICLMQERLEQESDPNEVFLPAVQYDPELGWVPMANYRSDDVNTNSRGLRGLREYPDEKLPDESRIVVVGDSFTWGEDVSDSEVYTEILSSQLENTHVVNMGVQAYGTDQQYLYLKREGFHYQPDLVIVSFYWANAKRNALSIRDNPKPYFAVENGKLRLQNVPVPERAAVSCWPAQRRWSYLWLLLKKNYTDALEHTCFAEKWELTERILDAMLEATTKYGARFLLVYIPGSVTEGPDNEEIFICEWTEKRNVSLLNTRKVFLKLGREERNRVYDGHWTAFGHRIAGEAIAEKIISENLLP
jgi:hypothetical protein